MRSGHEDVLTEYDMYNKKFGLWLWEFTGIVEDSIEKIIALANKYNFDHDEAIRCFADVLDSITDECSFSKYMEE